jgi:hypothetical protein
VGDDEVAVSEDALDLCAQHVKGLFEVAEEALEAFRAVGDQRVVLHVALTARCRCASTSPICRGRRWEEQVERFLARLPGAPSA